MAYKYADPFVHRLFEDAAALVEGEGAQAASVLDRLLELAEANAPAVAAYWAATARGRGVPDTAFKDAPPYLFPEEPPAHVFRTSGTSGAARGSAAYSRLGLVLMDRSILANARHFLLSDLERPAIVRCVPEHAAAPEMVMAYGMERIAEAFGDPALSDVVVGRGGLDLERLLARLDAAVAAQAPVVLLGGSFAFVNVCDALEARGRRFRLPAGSRLVDAGGFKGRSRAVTVEGLRALAERSFGIAPERCTNLFGMTELASQLYDAADVAVGPLGERPKAVRPFVVPRVREPQGLRLVPEGRGLLEVMDLAILDRPCVVLSGDWGIATPEGVAVAGRIERGQSRGCSLALDEITASEASGG